jgi:hypothetical protein
MSDDKPRKLRFEAGPGGYYLFVGEEKIGPYPDRAAVEQVIENWLARRAAGETDGQIMSTQWYRPTKPVPGTPIAGIGTSVAGIGMPAASLAAVIALRAESEKQAAEIERLKALKHPKEEGQEGGEASGKRRGKDAELRRDYAKDLIIAIATENRTLTRPEIIREVPKHWGQIFDRRRKKWKSLDWDPEERKLYKKCYEESTLYGLISDLVTANLISEPPPKK